MPAAGHGRTGSSMGPHLIPRNGSHRAPGASGPGSARTGEPVNMQVVDGNTGAPQAGATVNGSPTGSDGVATLTFADKGIYRLKAERAGEVRSNTVVLCVDPPGADPCTSSDSSAPS